MAGTLPPPRSKLFDSMLYELAALQAQAERRRLSAPSLETGTQAVISSGDLSPAQRSSTPERQGEILWRGNPYRML